MLHAIKTTDEPIHDIAMDNVYEYLSRFTKSVKKYYQIISCLFR